MVTIFSSFPIWIPFIYFAFMIPVASNSKNMLNKIGENGHPCLVHDLKGNAFSFLPLNMILTATYHLQPLLC